MSKKSIVFESFSEDDVREYAKSWSCGYKEAVRRLEKLIVT